MHPEHMVDLASEIARRGYKAEVEETLAFAICIEQGETRWEGKFKVRVDGYAKPYTVRYGFNNDKAWMGCDDPGLYVSLDRIDLYILSGLCKLRMPPANEVEQLTDFDLERLFPVDLPVYSHGFV